MTDDVEVVDIPDVSHENGDDNGFDFYGKIDELVGGLELPENVFEASCEVCDLIREVEDYKYSFTSFGGFDAVVAVSVFLGARQEGCPVPAQNIEDFIRSNPGFSVSSNFSGKKLRQLARKFKKKMNGFEPVFLDASDYVKFYVDRLSFPVNQEDLEDELDVSQVAVRYTYKEVVEGLTGLDTKYKSLEDVDVTPPSFGFYGEDVEGFALHLLEKAEDEGLTVLSKSPSVLAGAVLYISGRLIG